MSNKSLFSVTCLAILFTADQGYSQSICDSVLQNASRTSSTFTFESQANLQVSSACSQNFSSFQDFQTWGGEVGADLPMMEVVFGFNAAARGSSGEFQQQYNSKCQDFRSTGSGLNVTKANEQNYYGIVYETWEQCISQWLSSQSQGVFAYVSPQGDFQTYVVNIVTKTQAPPSTFKIESYAPGPDIVECKYNGKDVILAVDIPFRQTIPLTCIKNSQSDLRLTIVTGEGTVSQINLPSEPVTPGLEEQLSELQADLESLLPSGTVIAVDSPSACNNPAWEPYVQAAGRAIIGAGNGPGLNARSLGQTGGSEQVTLELNEIPAHSHSFSGTAVSRGGYGPAPYGSKMVSAASDAAGFSDYVPSGTIGETGNSDAHENMPPFIALHFCRKR